MMKMKKLILLGVLIAMDIAMMAGCVSGTAGGTTEKEITPVFNDDGIEIFAPRKLLTQDSPEKGGRLVHKTYYSKIAEKQKGINILLPPGYSEEKKYPVLYVLHGIFGDENTMVGTSVLFTNMINAELAKEMIVVYPFMYTSKTQNQCTAIDKKNIEAYDNFIDEMTSSIMPFISENFSVLEGRENTAITGFSMGGREALACAFYRQELFGYVGSVAPAPGLVPSNDIHMKHEGQFSESELVFSAGKPKPELVMLCCGDIDSVVGMFPAKYHGIMNENGTEHLWWIVPGSDHGDPAISSGFYNFAQRIFR